MGLEFAVSIAFTFLAGCLALTQKRLENHPRAQHWSGVGAVAMFFAAICVLGIWALGAMGMGAVQRIGLPLGALIFLFALFYPAIERYAGFNPPEPAPTSTGSPTVSYNGFLTPAGPATTSSGEFVIGTNTFAYSSDQLIGVTYYGTPFIKVSFSLDGRVTIDTTVADEQGHYIAIVHGVEFKASQERAFDSTLLDPHTLVVKDLSGKVVLHLRYESTNRIVLNGRFRVESKGKIGVVIFDEAGIHLPKGRPIYGNYFGDIHVMGGGGQAGAPPGTLLINLTDTGITM